MNELEIIIKPEKLDALKEVLDAQKVTGVMVTSIMGYGNQKGYTQKYRGNEYNVNLLPKLKVETVIPAKDTERIVNAVVQAIKTGNYGDGKIFVYSIENAVRIRTGDSGEEAL